MQYWSMMHLYLFIIKVVIIKMHSCKRRLIMATDLEKTRNDKKY